MIKITHHLLYLILIGLMSVVVTGCKKDEVSQLPIVTTTPVTSVKSTTAIGGGVMTYQGDAKVISCGVCWSTKPNPTIKDSKTTDSINVGNFTTPIKGLLPETTYYIRAYANTSAGTSYGAQLIIKTLSLVPATVTTNEPSNITATTARCGGNITFDGNCLETSGGICWSETSNPTFDNDRIHYMYGSGNGIYTCPLAGLKPNTTYYVRAFAQNGADIAYGNVYSFKTTSQSGDGIVFNANLTYGTVTDIDGNIYKTITIGAQTWMAENLKTTKYRDGSFVSDCYAYNNDLLNINRYGRLYNWNAVSSTNKLAPTGWHVPTDAEWVTLLDYLVKNGYSYGTPPLGYSVAQSLAAASDWGFDPIEGNLGYDLNQNNKSGFTALPSGNMDAGYYYNLGYCAFWWTSTEDGKFTAKNWSIQNDYNCIFSNSNSKQCGFAVRCIKD